MTTPIATEVARRRGQAPEERTPYGDLAAVFERIAEEATKLRWPSTKYQRDPVRFAHDILGVEVWHRQVEILEAVRDHTKVSVRSGHKIGKGFVAAILALWFYCSYPRARVILTSTTARQVDGILWREVSILLSQSGTCLTCRMAAERANPDRPDYPRPCPHSAIIDGDLHELARSGLKSNDFREIVGITASEAEAMAGTSGANLLYIADEASGIQDHIFQAIDGNMAGGAKLVMFSNPTRTEGRFYESHTPEKKDLYRQIHISSEEAAKVGIPGLATSEWVARMALECGGVESGEFLIRVRGDFAPEHTNKVIARTLIDEAFIRWETTPAEGPLHLGVDVARYGQDDTAIAVRRGRKIIEIVSINGLSEYGVADLVLQTAERHRLPREIVTVKIDSAGVGLRVVIDLNAKKDRFINVVPVHAGEVSRLPNEFALLRDQLWFSLGQWLREGGALPDDDRLAAELHAPMYTIDVRNRRRVESKDITRKQLKRSPDRADACALAAWDEAHYAVPVSAGPSNAPMTALRDAIYGPSGGLPSRDPIYGGRLGDSIYGRRR